MTKLLQRLHDELVRRHYGTTTRESYLRIVKAFHRRRAKAATICREGHNRSLVDSAANCEAEGEATARL